MAGDPELHIPEGGCRVCVFYLGFQPDSSIRTPATSDFPFLVKETPFRGELLTEEFLSATAFFGAPDLLCQHYTLVPAGGVPGGLGSFGDPLDFGRRLRRVSLPEMVLFCSFLRLQSSGFNQSLSSDTMGDQ